MSRFVFILLFSIAFFLSIRHRGVVAISVDLQRVDLDQCSSADPLFGNTHKCDPITTQVRYPNPSSLPFFSTRFRFHD